MSDKDSITKEYMKQSDRFADLFNSFCFGGEEKLQPEELKDMDTTSIVLPYGEDGAPMPKQKARDVLKLALKTDGKVAYCILGVENQAEIHTAMPVRNMLYDAMTLAEQVAAAAKSHKSAHNRGKDSAEYLSGFHREDKLLPVITLVVYWGADEWNAPITLREMYPDGLDEKILQYTNEYKVNLVSPAKMTDQQLDIFRSDLKAVLKFIKYSKDKHKLANLVNNNQEYKSLERLTAQTISVCSGQNFNFPLGEERIDVCKAIDDMITDARNEGITQGISQGISQGRNEATNEGMKNIIATVRDLNLGKDVAIQQLAKRYPVSQDEAVLFVNNNW
ncbi:Rpn family recombination-promoting nuclease/putative transposase [Selenomonas ruminantium]|uniref:Rpn family recombination-promoting nuclease/putative transposase n=1 Tax=Selenomonas ruminantium TaxID=971 RepID=UPI0026F3161A|nr:Rpn family recombination-promoting nuclease/putative transposase [Selenomonas ruminantium]